MRIVAAFLALVWLASFTPAEATARFIVNDNTSCTQNWVAACFCTVSGTGGTGLCSGSTGLPATSDTLTCDANSTIASAHPTFTVDAAPASLNTLTFTACALTNFDDAANNEPFTLGASSTQGFSCVGTSSVTIKMGSATWALTTSAQNVTAWVFTAGCGTLSAGTSTLTMTTVTSRGNQRAITCGGATYHNITVAGTAFFGACTLNGTLTESGGGGVTLTNSQTFTVPTLTVTGTSNTSPAIIKSNTSQSSTTLALTNAASLNWVSFETVTVTGAAITANNGFDFGNNVGSGGGSFTFTPPIDNAGATINVVGTLGGAP